MKDNRKEKYYWVTDKTLKMLKNGYIGKDQTVQERVKQIAEEFERIDGTKGIAEKFEDYVSRGWFSPSSPVWSNYGAGRGLSISCNNSYIPDSIEGIFEKLAEMAVMTKNGAGTSAYLGDIRPAGTSITAGGIADGPVRFLELFSKMTSIVSQNGVRRGSMAAYLPIEHPDALDFLEIKEHGHPIQDMSIGLTITDKFMERLAAGKPTKKMRKIWARMIGKKFNGGFPYILFKDNANNNKPQVYKDKGMEIVSSNLCNEIMLPTTPDESFVCCLSSMNLLHYDEWKDTDAVEVMTRFLDSVIEDYIQKTEGMKFMEAAHKFAKRHRAVGLGVLGWHSYLLTNRIPFESMEAKFLTSKIFKNLNEKSLKASKELAAEKGEPEVLKGYGERMTTRIAVAPTTSSAAILGDVSQSIEPRLSNYYTDNNAKGLFSYRSWEFAELLDEKGMNTEEVWENILKSGGSVKNLTFLTQHEKDVFKTFTEISQKEIIIQASIRQPYIDQGQSLNIKVSNNASAKEVSELIILAWELKVKGLYYQRGFSPTKDFIQSLTACTSCEG